MVQKQTKTKQDETNSNNTKNFWKRSEKNNCRKYWRTFRDNIENRKKQSCKKQRWKMCCDMAPQIWKIWISCNTLREDEKFRKKRSL